MAFVEDFDDFLDPGDFGEIWEHQNVEFHAIFDNATYTLEGENSVPVDVQEPMLHMKTSDTAGMAIGAEVMQKETGAEYMIQGIVPDGTGMCTVRLSALPGTAQIRKDALQRIRE